MVNNFTKLIVPPERIVKKTNLEELLAELKNKLHAYILTCKYCKEFQDNCWRILGKLEEEVEKLNETRTT